MVRAAAALAWARAVNPAPLPAPAAAALMETSAPAADAFAMLPWTGVYHPWRLPANAFNLILQLARSRHKDLRWRAVQGLDPVRGAAGHLAAAQVVAVLLERLSDDYNRIRAAAALALAEMGEMVLNADPAAVPALIAALDPHTSLDWGDRAPSLDSDASACGHAARLLAALSHRLTALERQRPSPASTARHAAMKVPVTRPSNSVIHLGRTRHAVAQTA
jgi:hypothetical protein